MPANDNAAAGFGSLPLLLKVEEVADLLRTSRKAIYDMAERGKLPGAVRIGRRLLVRRTDLVAFITGRGSSTGDRR